MYEISEDRPIYIQVKEYIENEILSGSLQANEQIPSTNQLVSFFNINPVTVLKGINLLTEEGIIYKKRGIGMFVHEEGKEILQRVRRKHFAEEYIYPLIKNGKAIGFTKEEINELINQVWEGE